MKFKRVRGTGGELTEMTICNCAVFTIEQSG